LTNQNQEIPQVLINTEDIINKRHSSLGVQTVHICKNSEQENTMGDKAQACDDCGLLFDSAHDVQRHVKCGWCPESNEPPTKKMKTEQSELDDDAEENEGYQHLWHVAQSQSKDRYKKLYDQYIDDEESEDDATDMARERTQPYTEKLFF
jgi:uncharacterized C2H2 Zn-finger protein